MFGVNGEYMSFQGHERSAGYITAQTDQPGSHAGWGDSQSPASQIPLRIIGERWIDGRSPYCADSPYIKKQESSDPQGGDEL
jgi:hypothetical protein